jgi:hypothetical protein
LDGKAARSTQDIWPSDRATQITPQQTEAEEIAKPNSGLNMNLRATTTWKIQNNDEGDGHPDSETMYVWSTH